MKDAVIGVIKDYGWSELRNYAVSLSKCGFEGDKLLFVDGISEEATKSLLRLGFTVIEYQCPESIRNKKCGSQEDPAAWGEFGRWRFKPVIDYLEANTPYRYIVWVDVRDVIFQTDPSSWLEENLAPAKLVGAAEGYLIKNQAHNALWASRVSPQDYHWLKNEEVICSGTFAGDGPTMLEVFKHMFWLHEKGTDPLAFDQGLWNLTARTSPFKEVFRIPKLKEGFCATGWPSKNLYPGMAYQTDQAPIYDWGQRVVYAPETGTPFSIVHQYDREPQWADGVTEIMKAAEKPPIILIYSCEAWRTNGINQACRDTWIKDLAGRIEHRFVLGKECKNLSSDEVAIDADDDYRSLPLKNRAAQRWATQNGYGYRFNCGSDTYIITSRFPASGYENYEYLGFQMYDNHRLCTTRNVQFAQGGAGYWLSPQAAAVVENAPIPDWIKFADDVFVGDALFNAGVPFSHDEGYWARCVPEDPVPKHDYGAVMWKTFHLSKWRGSPKYLPLWMHEVHKVWGNH